MIAIIDRRFRFRQATTGTRLMPRSLLGLCLLIALCLTTAAAERSKPTQYEQHEMEEGCIGQREIEYRRRHQELDPEARLELARATYADLRHEPGLRSDSIGGTNWTSIGPANLAGRMSRIALHPTVRGALLAGAAGGGIWKTTNSGTSWAPLTEAIPTLFIGASSSTNCKTVASSSSTWASATARP
jgi:hypothetical protein